MNNNSSLRSIIYKYGGYTPKGNKFCPSKECAETIFNAKVTSVQLGSVQNLLTLGVHDMPLRLHIKHDLRGAALYFDIARNINITFGACGK